VPSDSSEIIETYEQMLESSRELLANLRGRKTANLTAALSVKVPKLKKGGSSSGILDESCAELAPTAISYREYSAMPINNSGDQLLV
jgi:hypothetical protein